MDAKKSRKKRTPHNKVCFTPELWEVWLSDFNARQGAVGKVEEFRQIIERKSPTKDW